MKVKVTKEELHRASAENSLYQKSIWDEGFPDFLELGAEPVEPTPTEEKGSLPVGFSNWARVASLPGQINPIYNSKDLKVPEIEELEYKSTGPDILLLLDVQQKINEIVRVINARSKEDK